MLDSGLLGLLLRCGRGNGERRGPSADLGPARQLLRRPLEQCSGVLVESVEGVGV